MSLYLASQSPRRRELLQQIGVKFTVLSNQVDEKPLIENGQPEKAEGLVCRLAALKAQTALRQADLQAWPVLGADTVVCIDGEILGKPSSDEHAREMLERLSGQTHQVLSAVSMCQPHRQVTELSVSHVSFRPIEPAEMDSYGQTKEAMGKAGGYAIQGLAALFVTHLEGSYSGVVGLPLEKLFPLLRSFDVPYWENSLG